MRAQKSEDFNGQDGEEENEAAPAVEAAPEPEVVAEDPFQNQRDPRTPSELSLTEKFQCWAGRHPLLAIWGLAASFGAAAGTATYQACEIANQGMSYYEQLPSLFFAGVAAFISGGVGALIIGAATEAGTSMEDQNHKLTHRAARFDRIANQAAENGNDRKEARCREKARFERSVREGRTHRRSRYIIGPDRMPLEPGR